jgi:hypothetical protein
MSKQREDVEIKYLGNATHFDDFTGMDSFQFTFDVTVDEETKRFNLYVAGSHQGIDRVGMKEGFGDIFKDEETFKYVMDEMDAVIRCDFEEEYNQYIEYLKENTISKDKIEPEEPKQEKKQEKNKGFGMSM